MAEGWARYYSQNPAVLGIQKPMPQILVFSSGSHPSGRVNPLAIEAMNEAGIDISRQRSKGLNEVPDFVYEYIVTMGCGDSCPYILANHREDWQLDNPAGKDLAGFKLIRDQIKERVAALIKTLV